MENVAWFGIIKAGWPVLLVLLGMSIVTVGVVLEKWRIFSKIEMNSAPFLDSIKRSNDPQRIVAFCEKSTQPLAQITKLIFRAPDRREDKERMLQRAIQAQVQNLEARNAVLGTIASIAPFIGLLGTVIGIIKSFRAYSLAQSGGANHVTLGIAEALVGTAAGLIVAIPAVIAYNYFVNRLRRMTQDWELAGAEIIDYSLGR